MRKSPLVISILLVISAVSFAFQDKFDLKASIQRGSDVYIAQCMSCHMENGEGMEGGYPPLAKADYLMADKKRAIRQVLHGISGEIKVNGVTYNGEMVGFDLTDQEISDVVNYIQNSWGNKSTGVKPGDVAAVRKEQ